MHILFREKTTAGGFPPAVMYKLQDTGTAGTSVLVLLCYFAADETAMEQCAESLFKHASPLSNAGRICPAESEPHYAFRRIFRRMQIWFSQSVDQ
jgi:hypothetical protein